MSSTNLEFAMLSVGVFGTGLLGSLGAASAGHASASYHFAENSKDENLKASSESTYIGYLIASITLFASMIAFIVLLSLSFYKKP